MKNPSPRILLLLLLWRRLRLIKVVYRPFRSCVVRLKRARVSNGRDQRRILSTAVPSIWRFTDNRVCRYIILWADGICCSGKFKNNLSLTTRYEFHNLGRWRIKSKPTKTSVPALPFRTLPVCFRLVQSCF